MKSAICPKCFAHVSQPQWIYRCQNEACEIKDESITITASREEKPACPACGGNLSAPCCPACGYILREEDNETAALSVSIVGAEGSGKSHFLSVLIDELKQQVAKAYSCALYPTGGDDTIVLYEREYFEPLFTRGACLESTEQTDILPLIYTLVSNDERLAKNVGLTFYDACGANFESIAAMAKLNRSIYHSGGIIFLIDPTQLPVVREWQAARGGKICRLDPVAVLARTIYLMRAGMGQKNLQQKIDVPVAVCLTKLDSVGPLLDASSFLTGPSRHLRGSGFDPADFDACSLEAKSLIESWGGGEFISQLNAQFSTFAFFGLSALGNEPSGGSVHHIAPHRVTDPILWLLWRKKLIK